MSPHGSKNAVRKMRDAQRKRQEATKQIMSSPNGAYRVDKAELISVSWWIKGDPPKNMTRVFRVELKKPMFNREIRERMFKAFGDLNGNKK